MLQQKKLSYVFIITLAMTLLVFVITFPTIRTHLTLVARKVSPTTKAHPIPTPTATPVSNFGYIARTFTDAKGRSLPYYFYIPAHYDPQQKYPLVLMLEGSGERSNPKRTPEQNRQVLMHAQYVQIWSAQYSSPYNPNIQQRWPCFVVVPQLTTPQSWVNTNPGKGSYRLAAQPDSSLLLTKELLDSLQEEYTGIDANRLYITGLSLGGYGTWEAIERWPNYFAAAAPVSGAGDPTRAVLLTNLPIWAFHGSKDPRVPVSGSRDMINAIRAKGGKPRYTEFVGAGHGIWGRVYGFDTTGRVDDFYPWLFSQSKIQVQSTPR
jgi:predicted peptidase